jgi:hypothetical protein
MEPTPSSADLMAENDILHRIIDRLVNRSGSRLIGTPEARIFIAQLAPDLPSELAPPSDARLLASVDHMNNIQIMSVATQPATVIQDDYANRLLASGWHEEENPIPFMRKGFVTANPPGDWGRAFQYQEDGPVVMITCIEQDSETDVTITLHTDPINSPIAHRKRRADRIDPMSMLPVMSPPPGGYLIPQGGSGGSNTQQTIAHLTVDLNVDAISTHYRAQIEQAEWQLLTLGVDQNGAWSFWQKKSEGVLWKGIFLASRDIKENEFTLVFTAISQPPQPGGWIANRMTLSP